MPWCIWRGRFGVEAVVLCLRVWGMVVVVVVQLAWVPWCIWRA